MKIRVSKHIISDRSFWSLLFTNLLIIITAIWQDWNAMTLLWAYWSQSVIIGVFNFWRILSLKQFSTEEVTINRQPALPTAGTKQFMAYFFILHYGFFHLVYAAFLSTKFFGGQVFDIMYVLLSAVIFGINHFFSFRYNKNQDEKTKPNIGKIMFAPYSRIIPMHLTILFGFGLFRATPLIFLGFKTLADLVMHVKKHRQETIDSKH